MKKYLFPLLLLVVCILLFQDYYSKTQVTFNKPKEMNSISYVPSSDDDYSVSKSMGATIGFIYHIQTSDASIKHVEYWLEHYQNGSLKEIVLHSSADIVGKQNVKISLSDIDINENLEMWFISYRNGGNYGSAKNVFTKNNFNVELSHSILESERIVKDHIINLSIVIRNKTGNQIGISDGNIEETIQKNDEVFLFKCRFL